MSAPKIGSGAASVTTPQDEKGRVEIESGWMTRRREWAADRLRPEVPESRSSQTQARIGHRAIPSTKVS